MLENHVVVKDEKDERPTSNIEHPTSNDMF